MRKGLAHHMQAPFAWGVSDCSFVFDIIRDMTGFDAIPELRGHYTTETGALRALKKAGFETGLDLVAARFVEIDPALAHRGDIGYPATVSHPLMSPAIIDGAMCFSKHPGGWIAFPRHAIKRAWAV